MQLVLTDRQTTDGRLMP